MNNYILIKTMALIKRNLKIWKFQNKYLRQHHEFPENARKPLKSIYRSPIALKFDRYQGQQSWKQILKNYNFT